MTNLDSILKSRDITLPTKVCLVKAMVFPVAMYGCESWTVKKAEHRRIDAFFIVQLSPWLGFLAVCDTPVPCTEVQARPQSHSWGPLLRCGQSHLSYALVRPSGPGVKSSLSHSGFIILSRPQPYQQVRALR